MRRCAPKRRWFGEGRIGPREELVKLAWMASLAVLTGVCPSLDPVGDPVEKELGMKRAAAYKMVVQELERSLSRLGCVDSTRGCAAIASSHRDGPRAGVSRSVGFVAGRLTDAGQGGGDCERSEHLANGTSHRTCGLAGAQRK